VHLGQASFGGEQADDLRHEQRVPFGLAVDRPDQPCGWCDPGRFLDQPGHVGLGQTEQREVPGCLLAGQLSEREGKGVVAAELHVPVCPHREDAHVGELAGDELEQEQGRRVRGLQVVEHEHARLIGGGVAEEPGHGVEQAEPAGLTLQWRRRRDIGQLGQQLRHEGGPGTEPRSQDFGVGISNVGPQGLHPGPVRWRSPRFPAAAPRHPDAALTGSRRRLVRQAALADPRLAGQEEESASSRHGVVEPGEQLGQLPLAADEDERRPGPLDRGKEEGPMSVRRLEHIPGFRIDRVAAAAGDDPDVLRLENLDTDVPPPAAAMAATRAAIGEDDANSWLPFTGRDDLKEAVAAYIERRGGPRYHGRREIVITCGEGDAMLDALFCLTDPGDEVLLTDPTYAGMLNRVRLVGAVPRLVPLQVADGEWRLDLDAMQGAVTDRTRVVFLNNASFPSGWVASDEEWEAVGSICRERDVWLLYWGGFEGVLFDGRPVRHPAALPGMRDRTVTVGAPLVGATDDRLARRLGSRAG
jgi:Aminotransferase class I and II